MVPRLCWALVAATAVLLAPPPGVSAGTGPGDPAGRTDTRGDHRGARPDGGERRDPGRQPLPLNPKGWWVPTAPAAPAPGPSLVIIQQAPGAVQADPPPPPAEPPYYWYACGPAGTGPAPRVPAAGYCIGGLTPTHTGRPGPGKTIQQFQADTATCQEWAGAHAATLSGAAGSMQGRYDSAYQQCLQAAGNQRPGDVGPAQAENHPPPPSRR